MRILLDDDFYAIIGFNRPPADAILRGMAARHTCGVPGYYQIGVLSGHLPTGEGSSLKMEISPLRP